MVKMSDVAKLAKVSPATVSRVLSGSSYISEETRKRVLEAVKVLGYKPNRLASNLRKMSSQTVVVVLPDITNPFFASIVLGMQHVARDQGYNVLLGNTDNSLQYEQDYLDMAKERIVDGLIMLTAQVPDEIVAISQFMPVVLVCEYIEGHDIPSVIIDNVSAARQNIEHLVALGHRRIAFISGPENSVIKRDRVKGYQQALNARGIESDPALIREGDLSLASGYKCTEELLALTVLPTAICASGDQMAVGAIKAIQAHGLRVPEDIAVVSFGNISLSTVVQPELTTIAQPTYEMGVRAMEMLFNILAGKKLDQRQVVFPHQLIVRQSCGAKK